MILIASSDKVTATRRSVFLGAAALALAPEARAQTDPCARYYGQGYALITSIVGRGSEHEAMRAHGAQICSATKCARAMLSSSGLRITSRILRGGRLGRSHSDGARHVSCAAQNLGNELQPAPGSKCTQRMLGDHQFRTRHGTHRHVRTRRGIHETDATLARLADIADGPSFAAPPPGLLSRRLKSAVAESGTGVGVASARECWRFGHVRSRREEGSSGVGRAIR